VRWRTSKGHINIVLFRKKEVVPLFVLLTGQTLNQSYGFESAIISIFIGNAILLFLGRKSLLIKKMKNNSILKVSNSFFPLLLKKNHSSSRTNKKKANRQRQDGSSGRPSC